VQLPDLDGLEADRARRERDELAELVRFALRLAAVTTTTPPTSAGSRAAAELDFR